MFACLNNLSIQFQGLQASINEGEDTTSDKWKEMFPKNYPASHVTNNLDLTQEELNSLHTP